MHAYAQKKDSKGKARSNGIHFHIPERIIANKAARRAAAAPPKHHAPHPAPTMEATTNEAVAAPELGEAGGYAGVSNARDLTMLEALALLEGRTFVPKKVNIWQRLAKLEAFFRTPTSIYAAKVSAASLVFGSFLWAEHTRSFFLKYNLTGSLLTLVVAL